MNVHEGSVALCSANTKRQSVVVGVSAQRVNERDDYAPKFAAASAVAVRVSKLVCDAVWYRVKNIRIVNAIF